MLHIAKGINEGSQNIVLGSVYQCKGQYNCAFGVVDFNGRTCVEVLLLGGKVLSHIFKYLTFLWLVDLWLASDNYVYMYQLYNEKETKLGKQATKLSLSS